MYEHESRYDVGGREGACLWKGGPWHPFCREADRSGGERVPLCAITHEPCSRVECELTHCLYAGSKPR